jgi:hypothetical protein
MFHKRSSVINSIYSGQLGFSYSKMFHYSLHAHSHAVFLKALPYFAKAISYAHKMFMKWTPWANVIKLLLFFADDGAKQARLFVSFELFLPVIMFSNWVGTHKH